MKQQNAYYRQDEPITRDDNGVEGLDIHNIHVHIGEDNQREDRDTSPIYKPFPITLTYVGY